MSASASRKRRLAPLAAASILLLAAACAAGAAAAPAASRTVFFSGHSLINLDMPWNVHQIARANRRPFLYNAQIALGANMKARLEGGGNEQQGDGEKLTFKVLDELRRLRTIPGVSRYDALVVTEASEIASQVLWTDTVQNAAAFHKALLAGNPEGEVWLYDSWDDTHGDVPAWMRKTRADHLWYQCVASWVNRDPAAGKRPMRLLPAGVMLVTVGEAIQAGKIPGLKSPKLLFDADGHHASNLGNYVLAMTVYAALYGHKPELTAVKPTGRFGKAYDDLPPAAALTALRDQVWDGLQAFERAGPGNRRSMAECRKQLPSRCEEKDRWACGDKLGKLFAD
jgi:hypothetical protein